MAVFEDAQVLQGVRLNTAVAQNLPGDTAPCWDDAKTQGEQRRSTAARPEFAPSSIPERSLDRENDLFYPGIGSEVRTPDPDGGEDHAGDALETVPRVVEVFDRPETGPFESAAEVEAGETQFGNAVLPGCLAGVG